MDLFDECILEALGDGRPRDFEQILLKVGFSHNTLRLHLSHLVDQGLIVKEKMPSKGLGRPKFMYSVPPKVVRQVHRLLSEDYAEIISLTFNRFKSVCKYEKGGYCKKIKGRCEAQNCPQTLK
jgi:predicted ArsR family transcriptional regulator